MTNVISLTAPMGTEAIAWTRGLEAGAESTLGQQIYQQLESKLLLGEWLPNTKVTLRTLALSLNTSMQPVREAVPWPQVWDCIYRRRPGRFT